MICCARPRQPDEELNSVWIWTFSPTSCTRTYSYAKQTSLNQGRGQSIMFGGAWAPGMASAGARAYIGGLGAEPPAGSRGRAPGQGVRGAKPPWSWKPFSFLMRHGSSKFASFSAVCKLHKPQAFVIYLSNKKLSYRRGTARCVVSIEILPIATQQCRNYLYDKSWPNDGMKLEIYSEAMHDRQCALNYDATESLSLSQMCHKQTDHGRLVDITCIPTTCCGEIF